MRQVPIAVPAAIALCSGLAMGLALAAPEPAPDETRLEDILVTPQPNPLDQSSERLRQMLEQSTPCLGCDSAPLTARRTLAERVVRYVFFPAEPPALDRDARREAREAVEHRAQERGPEMDFLKF